MITFAICCHQASLREYLKFLYLIALVVRGPEILVLHNKGWVTQLCGTGEFQGEFQEDFLCSQALVAEFQHNSLKYMCVEARGWGWTHICKEEIFIQLCGLAKE